MCFAGGAFGSGAIKGDMGVTRVLLCSFIFDTVCTETGSTRENVLLGWCSVFLGVFFGVPKSKLLDSSFFESTN